MISSKVTVLLLKKTKKRILPRIFFQGPFFYHLQKSKDQIMNHKNIQYTKVLKAKWSQKGRNHSADIFCFQGILASQPNVHSGGFSRGRVRGCGCWRY